MSNDESPIWPYGATLGPSVSSSGKTPGCNPENAGSIPATDSTLHEVIGRLNYRLDRIEECLMRIRTCMVHPEHCELTGMEQIEAYHKIRTWIDVATK